MVVIHAVDVQMGDCFLISIDKEGRSFNLLIDGGCQKYNAHDTVEKLLNGKKLNGVVVTHLDNDHIGGIVNLYSKTDLELANSFILFNKYDESIISYNSGIKLMQLISKEFPNSIQIKSYSSNFHKINEKIGSKVEKKTDLEVIIFSKESRRIATLSKDTVYLTILAPTFEDVKTFMKHWKENKRDGVIVNRSSIALIIEYNNTSLLMLGDSYLDDVINELKTIKSIKEVNFLKMSHHGAIENNNNILDFVKKYNCKKIYVTMPETRDEKHPDHTLIMGLINNGCTIYTPTDCEYAKNNDLSISNSINI